MYQLLSAGFSNNDQLHNVVNVQCKNTVTKSQLNPTVVQNVHIVIVAVYML